MELGRFLDVYTVKARLLPVLLVTLPIGLVTMILSPNTSLAWKTVWGLIGWSGGGFLLAQLGRDAGLKKESQLFKSWGGKPTTKMLRHRDFNNSVILARRHKKLKALIKDVKLPTSEEEARDPNAADETYEACATFLREKTRDRKEFALVFEENCSYGFRRNLWGMKPIGFIVSLLCLGVIIVSPIFEPSILNDGRIGLVVLAGGANLFLMVLWVFVFRPSWVKVAANAYAERLLEACEQL